MAKHKKDTSDKSVAQMIHFKRRLWARYRIRIDDNEYKRICSCIRKQKDPVKTGVKYEMLNKQSLTRVVYKLNYQNVDIIAIYDKSRGTLATCLGADMDYRTHRDLAGNDEAEWEWE